MYFKMRCPNCQKGLKVKEEYVGKKARCPYCKGSVLVECPRPKEECDLVAGGTSSGSATQESISTIYRDNTQSTKPDGTNVSLLSTVLVGLGITVAFYLIVFFVLKNTYFGELFVCRGWVPYVIVLLTSWAASTLFFKYRKLMIQRDSLLFDVLPVELSHEIRPDNVDRFHRHILALPYDVNRSFLLRRVFQALEHFKARGSVQEVASLLTSQAEIDTSAVESSYTILKVLIWAIPILGFIGTVIGIGSAVGGFSTSLQDIQEIELIKNSLGSVTTGLAVAFDTTLLALVVSLIVMLPTSSIQKTEEDLLISIEEYCNENLLGRLNAGEVETATEPEQIRRAVSAAMTEHDVEFHRWLGELKSIGATVTQQVADGWKEVHRHVQKSHKSSLQQFKEILSGISEERTLFVGQVKAVRDDQLKQFSGVISSVGERASSIQREIVNLQDNQVHNFKDVVSTLAKDMEDLHQQAHERQKVETDTLREMAEQFGQTLRSIKEEARAMHTEMAKSVRDAGSDQQQTLHRLDEICVSLGEQVQAAEKQMIKAETSRYMAVEQLLTKLADERNAATHAAAGNLAEVRRVENEVVSSIASCQQRLSKDMERFATVQQKIASHLEYLTKSNSFNMKLSRIEEELNHLSPILNNFNNHTETRHPREVASVAQADGLGRRIWQRIVRGGGNGST